MPHIVYVVTHPVSAKSLLKGQLRWMKERGFRVSVVCGTGPEAEVVRRREGVDVREIPMSRDPDPKRDPAALRAMIAAMRDLRPDLVNASTPKGGLLGLLAARAMRVPVRIYTLRGLRLETATGVKRRAMGLLERLASSCAHRVVCVSPSLLDLAVGEGHIQRRKAIVLGEGSSNGVDPARFLVDDAVKARSFAWREKIGVDRDAPVVGFAGRLVDDKGLPALLGAFDRIRADRPGARLVMVGDGLGGDEVPRALKDRILATPGALALGHTDDMPAFFGMIDVLAFPSLREGFPNVPLEAAAAGVPAVGFRSTGVIDAIQDGVTGSIVGVHDEPALAAALARYLDDPALSRAHGSAARERAISSFSHERVWEGWLGLYRGLLAVRRIPCP